MQIHILKSKIQQLIVSESSVEYPGSIALPEELLRAPIFFLILKKETVFGIKSITIKMFVPKDQKRRVEQQETKLTKRVEKNA